jgi:uncharacterized protein involved in exopolysaccharide biosynthesis
VPESRVIGIEFSSQDEELAAQVPNALVDAYLAFQSGAKLETNTDASAWLEPEITRLREKVVNPKARLLNTVPRPGSCWSTSRTQ